MDIQHIGSTAVPGLHAKPILDICVGVNTIKDFNKFIKIFENAGYIQVQSKNRYPHLVFSRRSKDKITEFLHIVKYKGVAWNRYIKFRDQLISNKKNVNQYFKLKRKLALRYPNDRMKYTEGKTKFIMNTLKKP